MTSFLWHRRFTDDTGSLDLSDKAMLSNELGRIDHIFGAEFILTY